MKGLKQLKMVLYECFMADANLISLLGSGNIYDLLQKDSKIPYISYGTIICKNVDQIHEQTWQHELELIVAANADTTLTTHNILARLEYIIDEILPLQPLSDGYQLVSINLTGVKLQQQDFKIIRGSVNFTVLLEKGVI